MIKMEIYRQFVCKTKEDGEKVLEAMRQILEGYGVITVEDLHDLGGLNSTYVDQKWGWHNLDRVQVVEVHDGWLVKLPEAEALT